MLSTVDTICSEGVRGSYEKSKEVMYYLVFSFLQLLRPLILRPLEPHDSSYKILIWLESQWNEEYSIISNVKLLRK